MILLCTFVSFVHGGPVTICYIFCFFGILFFCHPSSLAANRRIKMRGSDTQTSIVVVLTRPVTPGVAGETIAWLRICIFFFCFLSVSKRKRPRKKRPQKTSLSLFRRSFHQRLALIILKTPSSSACRRVCTEPRDPDATPAVNLNGRFGSGGGGVPFFSLSLSLSRLIK